MAGLKKENAVTDTEGTDGIGEASGLSSNPHQAHGEVVVAELASQLGEMMEELEPELTFDYLRCPGGWKAHCSYCNCCQFNCNYCEHLVNEPGKIPDSCKDFLEKVRSMAEEENAVPLMDGFIEGTGLSASSSNPPQGEVVAQLTNQLRGEMNQLEPPLTSRKRPDPHWQPKKKNMTPYQGKGRVFGYFRCLGGCKGHCTTCKVGCDLCHHLPCGPGEIRFSADCKEFCDRCVDYGWMSRSSFANLQQKCAVCQMKVYPYAQRALRPSDFNHPPKNGRSLHHETLCQGCVKSGNCKRVWSEATGCGGCHKK